MKNLETSGCVIVIGPPSCICFSKIGITNHEILRRFQNEQYKFLNYIYVIALQKVMILKFHLFFFVPPMILVGFTALSVEIKMNFLTFASLQAFKHLSVPKTLFE